VILFIEIKPLFCVQFSIVSRAQKYLYQEVRWKISQL